MSSANIIIFARGGAAALRETLHELRETAGHPHEVVVLASECDERRDRSVLTSGDDLSNR